MFFTRNDKGALDRAKRRVKSTRASAFLEFALIGAILMMVSSAMIEFVELWDAKIMANHTAWVVGRIATVQAGQIESSEKGSLEVTDEMQYVATAFMATCSMGMYGDGSGSFSKNWLDDKVNAYKEALKKYVSGKLKEALEKMLKDVVSKGGSAGEKIIAEIVDMVVKNVVSPLIDAISDALVDAIARGILDNLYEWVGQNRQIRQLLHAAKRVSMENVVVVTECDKSPFIFSKRVANPQPSPITYPRVVDSKSKTDDWFVTSDSPWPAERADQRMIRVDINWPFSRGWIFPIFSSGSLTGDLAGKGVMATGHALFYPQPKIFNEHLSSINPKDWDPGQKDLPEDFQKLKDAFRNFLKVACFAMQYRLGREDVGPHDSSGSSGSWKGLGLSSDLDPPWGIKNTKDAYWKKDGLVYWMERADPNDSDAWSRENGKHPDYYANWKTISGTGDEKCYFWAGIPFHAIKYKPYKRCQEDTWKKDVWFHWGEKGSRSPFQHKRHVKDNRDNSDSNRMYNPLQVSSYIANIFAANEVYFLVEGKTDKGLVPDDAMHYYTSINGWANGGLDFEMLKAYCNSNTRLRLNLTNWSECIGANYSRDEFLRREKAVATLMAKTVPTTYKNMMDYLRRAEAELEKYAMSGKEGEPEDSGYFDFGMDDEEIMKDPSKAVELMKAKLEKMRTESMAILYQITEQIEVLQSLGSGPLNAFKEVADRRASGHYKSWTACLGHAIRYDSRLREKENILPPGDADGIYRRFRAQNPCGEDPFVLTKKLEDAVDPYSKALDKLYDLEIQYGEIMNLKAAKQERKRKDDPSVPVDPVNPDKPVPDPSSPGTGSDDDWLGDSWRWQKDGERGGWHQDGGGEDI